MTPKHWPGCKRGRYCTLDHTMTDAAMARRKRWEVGMVVEGHGGCGVLRVVITAIGREALLGVPAGGDLEATWTLVSRCWRRVRA